MNQIELLDTQNEALHYLFNPEYKYVREVLYGGKKGGGKSFLGCLYTSQLSLSYPGVSSFVARNTLTDLRKYTIPSFFEVFEKRGIPRSAYKFNHTDNIFTFYNDSRILLLSTDYLPSDPMYERFGSMQQTAGWIEEGGEHHQKAYENLKLSIGRWKNKEYNLPFKLLITANPKKNWMYNNFIKEISDDKKYIQAGANENHFLPPQYIETLNQITDKVQRQRLLLGIWDYDDDDNTLIRFEKINDLFTNSYVSEGEKFISADIAITNDMFVLYVWSGLRIIDYFATNHIEGNQIIDVLQKKASMHQVPYSNIIIDADGQGRTLMGFIPGSIKFHGNATPFEKEYRNLKAWANYRLADEVNKGGIFIACPMAPAHKEMLINDLQMIKRSSKLDDKLGIMSKHEVKELLQRSPDFSDSLAFRMFFLHTRRK